MLYLKLCGIINSVSGFQTYYPGVRTAFLRHACRQPLDTLKNVINNLTAPIVPINELIEPEVRVLYETDDSSYNPAFEFWIDAVIRH